MSGTDIFLSYARTDRATARVLADCLTAEGFHVWWDASLHSGETFDEVIEQRLRDAKAVVVLWSPRSVASRWVRAEATQADRKNKLMPAIIEACDRPIIFELTHAADLCDWHGDMADVRWRTFVEDLRRLVDAAPADEAHAPARTAEPPAPAALHQAARPQPQARQALRPGNDEVIYTGVERRSQPRSVVELPVSQARADDAEREVHCLEVEDGDVADELFAIESSTVKLGRTAPADIVIPHTSVSREHCIIGIANDELLITDLNSTNGTFIDGERIRRATILPVGAVVKVGQVSLRHSIRTAAEVARGTGFGDRKGGAGFGRLAATS